MPKTQAEIDVTAERVRASGLPDFLNRWIGMTPEKLAESEATIARHVAADRTRNATGDRTMPKDKGAAPSGSKAAGLRAQREARAAGTPPVNAPAATAKAAKAKADKVPGAKAATAAKVAKKAAAKPPRAPVQAAGSATRQGGKMEIIGRLLARKKGCTADEVKEACGWPSVSMPQQAKALGVTLYKHKDSGKPTRYADHALTENAEPPTETPD